MVIGDRVDERMRAAGHTQSSLARKLGVAQPTIAKLIGGSAQSSGHLHRIARELRTTAEYLTGETDDPVEGALLTPTPQIIAEQLGLAMIPEVDISLSMGGGSVLDDNPSTRLVPFRSDWIQRITRGRPADLVLTQGKGDSMMPTILDGDDVIFNRSERIIRDQDLIWAVGYGDLGMIKRVRRLPRGRFQLNSDNSNVSPIDALEDEIFVIGRVVWIGRRM